ncbi:protein disulfide-isomerase 2-like isoform X2 [Dermacentor andersoni]|uniref:protein disulfide-isomerase 2-like isoform X2 n=1 Tax=Dermacentor andersoni TaxID=34620 RepID=UPI0024177388|nr:thioredoxin domain-containing protein 11-like isoform X2 [Dermacentor andersoni]
MEELDENTSGSSSGDSDEPTTNDDANPRVAPREQRSDSETSETLVDEDNLDGHRRRTMTSYARELFFLTLLLLASWAALHETAKKTRPASPPRRFFSKHSPVNDSYRGQLDPERVHKYDVSLVLYYAPWDAASMRARDAFEYLAYRYRDQFAFGAVNCWWPNGRCRKRHSPSLYPIVVAHVRDFGDVVFPMNVTPTMRTLDGFLQHVSTPLVRVTSAVDLAALLRRHTAVVLGIVGDPRGGAYESFYGFALQALTRDPWRDVAFAVAVDGRAALEIGVEHAVTLFTWNASLGYSEKGTDYKTALDWTFNKAREARTLHWVSPSGLKSRSLSKLVENQSTLVLYAEHGSPEYFQMHQLSQDYKACDLKGRFSGLSCRTNSTVNFVALDGRHSEFAPPGLLSDGIPTAVIYATKDEAQYVIRGPVTAPTLKKLVVDFADRVLDRHLNSVGPDSIALGSSDGLVAELSSKGFRKLMLDATRDAVVLFYASWCGFCKAIYHHFFATARFFRGFKGLIFARRRKPTFIALYLKPSKDSSSNTLSTS